MQAEGQVRVSRVVLENSTVGSGAAVDPQTAVVVPVHQGLVLVLLPCSVAQAGAARTQLPQHKLTDAKVKTQNHDVEAVDQQERGSLVPGTRRHVALFSPIQRKRNVLLIKRMKAK